MARGSFNPSMVRMQMPADKGAFTIAGIELEIDEDNCVELPAHLVSEAESHGLTRAGLKAAVEDKKDDPKAKRR